MTRAMLLVPLANLFKVVPAWQGCICVFCHCHVKDVQLVCWPQRTIQQPCKHEPGVWVVRHTNQQGPFVVSSHGSCCCYCGTRGCAVLGC